MQNTIMLLARARHAERYSASRTSGAAAGTARNRSAEQGSARTRVGWMLVGLGLRLVAGSGRRAGHRVGLIWQ